MSRTARLLLAVVAAMAVLALPVVASAASGHPAKRAHKHAPAVHQRPVPAAVIAECQAELLADPAAFAAKYANPAGHEALGRCIRLNAAHAPATTPATPSAAKACAAEKAADPAAFQAKYANAAGRGAFGHCARLNVAAQVPADQPASGDTSTDDTSSDDTSTAAPPAAAPSTDNTSTDDTSSDPSTDGVDFGAIFG